MFYRLRPKYCGPGPYAEWETCNHDLDSPVAQHNLRDDAFPDFQPEFQPVLLSRKSSLVDFVDAAGVVGGTGLLMSEKALGVLEGMKLPPHQIYPLEVIHKEKRVEHPRYFWMQILLFDNYGWRASERTSSANSRQVQVCQMPRSFSRMAGRFPRTRAWCMSSFGNVSSVPASGCAIKVLLLEQRADSYTKSQVEKLTSSALRVAQPVMRRSTAAEATSMATPITPVTMRPAKASGTSKREEATSIR